MTWQPIETASKDGWRTGEPLLLAVDAWDRGTSDMVLAAHVALAYWHGGRWEYAHTQRAEDGWRGRPIMGAVRWWQPAPPLP